MISGLDFALISMPRCGSHMVAFALDSHPDINMRGELEDIYPAAWSGVGKLRGRIVRWCELEKIEQPKKMIVLLRDAQSLIEAHGRACKETHYFEPATIELKNYRVPEARRGFVESTQRDGLASLNGNKLVINYDAMTSGKDIRALPNSAAICDFLGIDLLELKTKTHKPSVIYVG